MAMDETTRHRIHGKLEALIGGEEAAAIMTAITDTNLETRMERLEIRMERLEGSFDHTREVLTLQLTNLADTLRVEMHQQYRSLIQWTVGAILATMSLGLAAGRLLAG